MAICDSTTFDERDYARRCGKFYTYIHLTGDQAGEPGRIFYVGKGCKYRAWGKTQRNQYWQRIHNKHGSSVKICAYWDSEDEAHQHEIFLISCFRDMGIELCNATDGGEGVSGWRHKPETIALAKERMKGYVPPLPQMQSLWDNNRGKSRPKDVVEKIALANRGKKRTPEQIDAMRGRVTSPETRELQRQAKLGQTLADEHRKKIGESLKGRQKSPEECAAISAGKLGKKASDETKAILKASNRSRDPEVRERIRQATIAAMNRPDVKEKVSAASRGRKHSPETIAKRAESLRKAFADPETKKRLSEARKATWARRKAAQQGIEDAN